MRGRPASSDLWGKFRDESRDGPAWHPLVDHCTDVACVLEALLAQPMGAAIGLALWAVINGLLVFKGYADLPFISLALGFVGAGAVVAAATLLSQSDLCRPLRYCGSNSIVIYLAFFLGMAASRVILLKTGIVTDIGTVSLLVTAAGITGALVLHWLVRNTPLRFLFERPAWAHIPGTPGSRGYIKPTAVQPAE